MVKTKSSINYLKLVDWAMHQVVKQVLETIATSGLQGEQHFLVSFKTNYPGVQLSKKMQERYPEEITIVLQHQFTDLTTNETSFSLNLSFDNIVEKVVVPYKSLTSFADPLAKFAVQFSYHEEPIESEIIAPTNQLKNLPAEPFIADSSNVVTLDHFRNKNKPPRK